MDLTPFEEVLFPGFIQRPEEHLNNVKALEYREGDVLMCGYPSSGNHWNESLIRCLLRTDSNDNILSRSSIIDMHPPEFTRTMESPRVFFTHLWPNRIPPEHVKKRGKMVLLLRNPKDVLVASYHHFTRSRIVQNKLSWDDYFEAFINGRVIFGSVFTYLQQWHEALQTDKFDIRCFYFEDNKANGVDYLRRLAQHIGVEKTDAELEAIVAECSLESLKSKIDPGTIPKTLLDDRNQHIIYRKGVVGDWKNHFTVAQNERFDKILIETVNDLMFTFRYE